MENKTKHNKPEHPPLKIFEIKNKIRICAYLFNLMKPAAWNTDRR